MEVLGPLRITARGGEIRGGLRKARELAAFLAVHPDGVTGEAISEALWPESPPGHGAAQRNLALRKLRDLLRAAAGLTEPMLITLAAERYRLDPAFISTDVADFQAALEAARSAADDTARLDACQQATALYRGPLADGAGYEWAEPYAEAARRRALDAWTRIAELLEPARPDQALAALETALGHDPFNEYLYQRIMRLQAAAGRPDAVRRTLRLLETRLGELGVTPGPQTRQAAAALLGMPVRATTRRGPAAAGGAAASPGCPPAPARPPARPVTRPPLSRLPVARVPPADSKPRQEPRYHDRGARHAIHYPGLLPRRNCQARQRAGRRSCRGSVPPANPYSIRGTCSHRKPRPAPFRRHRPIWTFRWTPRLIQHHACKTIWGRRAGDNQVSLMPVLDVPGLLLIYLLTVRRPSRARPRGARPGAWPGKAGGTEARRGWPGRTWRGRGRPPGRRPGQAVPGPGRARRTVTAWTRIAHAAVLSNARPGRAGGAELTGPFTGFTFGYRPGKPRNLYEFEAENR